MTVILSFIVSYVYMLIILLVGISKPRKNKVYSRNQSTESGDNCRDKEHDRYIS